MSNLNVSFEFFCFVSDRGPGQVDPAGRGGGHGALLHHRHRHHRLRGIDTTVFIIAPETETKHRNTLISPFRTTENGVNYNDPLLSPEPSHLAGLPAVFMGLLLAPRNNRKARGKDRKAPEAKKNMGDKLSPEYLAPAKIIFAFRGRESE